MYAATPAYLDMMGVRLVGGRLFTARDTTGTPLVVLVNETMARTMWPGQSAIGKCVKAGHAGSPELGDPMAAAAYPAVPGSRRRRARFARAVAAHGRRRGEADAVLRAVRADAGAPFPDAPTCTGCSCARSGDPERLVAPVQRIIQSTSAAPVYARVRPYQTLHRSAASVLATRGDALLGLRRPRARHRGRRAVRGGVVSRDAAHAGDRRAARVRRLGGRAWRASWSAMRCGWRALAARSAW